MSRKKEPTTLFPSIPFKGGPFHGQRRPIIDGVVPNEIRRLRDIDRQGGVVQVYERRSDDFGADYFAYVGSQPFEVKK